MKSNISTTKIDILNRTPFVDQLFDIVEKLSEKQKSCTFAVNGKWGCGKSFVMDMFEEKIKTQQNEETANDKYLLFHYDCWEYDYYEEPLFAIVSAILDKIKSEAKNPIFEKAKIDFSIAIRALDKLSGFGLVENIRKAEKEYEEDHNPTDFDAYFGFKDTLKEVQTAFQKLAEDKTLVVVVDELDRCLPTYTVKVLERLHHIFGEIKNCIVILAVDKEQLEHTVQSIYGTDCNTDAYLRKFIDFEVELNYGTVNQNLTEKYSEYIHLFDKSILKGDIQMEEILSAILDEIDSRSRDKILEKAKLLHTLSFSDDAKPDYGVMCAEVFFLTLSMQNQDHSSRFITKFDYDRTFRNLFVSQKIKNLLLEKNRTGIEKMYNSSFSSAFFDFDMLDKKLFTFFIYYWLKMYQNTQTHINPIFDTMYEFQKLCEKNVECLKKFAQLADIIK